MLHDKTIQMLHLTNLLRLIFLGSEVYDKKNTTL